MLAITTDDDQPDGDGEREREDEAANLEVKNRVTLCVIIQM